MSILDPFLNPLRSLLGTAEHEVLEHTPMAETRDIEAQVLEAVTAVHRATDSIERHVEVIETLAESLPPLTESVTRLTNQLGELLTLTAPLAAAERDVSRVTHLFGRHHHEETAPEPEGPPAPPAAPTS